MGIWIVLCYLILGSLFMGLMLLFSPSDGLQFFAQHMGRRERERERERRELFGWRRETKKKKQNTKKKEEYILVWRGGESRWVPRI